MVEPSTAAAFSPLYRHALTSPNHPQQNPLNSAYWVADLFNSTFDAVMRSIQGANLVPGVWGSRKAYPSQACPQSVVLADSNAYDQVREKEGGAAWFRRG